LIDKYFSRKGAKTQRGIRKLGFSVAPLRLCVSIFLFLSLTSPAFTQRKTSARFDPDGTFWIHGEHPADFSEFDSINLNAKRVRYLGPAGLRTRTALHHYKTLIVKRDNFTFTTMSIRGVSYSFTGKFLKGGVYASGILDDETPVLEGTLTKFRDGKKVAEANLKFVYFGGT
jgi:hypothetical protein